MPALGAEHGDEHSQERVVGERALDDDVAGAAQRGSRRVAANDGVNPGAAPVATGVCAETRACSRSSG